MNESETRAEYIDPKLKASGWGEVARNYWKYLKAKLEKENSQVISNTTQLKLLASDGKSKTKAYALFESSLIDSIEECYLFTKRSYT